MAPHTEMLPDMRAWTPSDARLSWKWKDGESKEKPGGFVVRGFGGLRAATVDVSTRFDARRARHACLDARRRDEAPATRTDAARAPRAIIFAEGIEGPVGRHDSCKNSQQSRRARSCCSLSG